MTRTSAAAYLTATALLLVPASAWASPTPGADDPILRGVLFGVVGGVVFGVINTLAAYGRDREAGRKRPGRAYAWVFARAALAITALAVIATLIVFGA